MCTFIMAWRIFDDAPMIVAANRDERLDRPSRPPSLLTDQPRIIAPQDEEAGGTWIGYNEHRVFVAILNRWTDAELEGERSRGLLVMDALKREAASKAAHFVEDAVERHEYEGFNLVVADATDAVLYEWDGELRRTNFDQGVHVVVNVGADDHFEIPAFPTAPPDVRTARRAAAEAQAKNTKRARADLHPRRDETVEEWRDGAAVVLRDHDYGICVHRGEFGTRSSSIITVHTDGTVDDRFADGAPCEIDIDYVTVETSTIYAAQGNNQNDPLRRTNSMTDFVPVATTDTLSDGEGTVVEANGHTIALFRTEGEFYAIGNECTHTGGPLGEGDLNGTTVTCPWHGSQFDITSGEVLEPPAVDSEPEYEVRIEGDEVQVGI